MIAEVLAALAEAGTGYCASIPLAAQPAACGVLSHAGLLAVASIPVLAAVATHASGRVIDR